MLQNFLLILGVLTLALALRSFQHPLLQKLGALAVMAATYLIGFFATGSSTVGTAAALLWLLLPWVDLLTRIRRLTLPLERDLRHKSPPNAQIFPALNEITEEIEGESFEHVNDTGWEWDDYQQFFRLFYKADERLQAAICLVDQQDVAFYYLSLSSRAKDGTIWITWNYPFSYSLKMAPHWRVNRLRGDLTFLQLLENHRQLLHRYGVSAELLEELDAERMQAEIQKDLQTQVAHNLSAGVLTKTDAGEIRYSWRGLLFLWVQFLRDLVRIT